MATLTIPDHTTVPGPELVEDPTLRDVLRAVNDCKQYMVGFDNQLRNLSDELVSIHQDIRKTVERVTTLEERVSTVEDTLYPFEKELRGLQEKTNQQAAKLDEIEDRLRRNNVRVIGLPERSEGSNTISFMEGWLRDIFGPDTFSSFFSIERAHRVPFKPPQEGGRPRSLLFKLFYYGDKVTLLQKARERGDITYNGARISFYPDFSPDLQKRRAEFTQIKRTLQQHKVVYALQYPARLRVTALGRTFFFNSPAEVAQWLETNSKDL